MATRDSGGQSQSGKARRDEENAEEFVRGYVQKGGQ